MPAQILTPGAASTIRLLLLAAILCANGCAIAPQHAANATDLEVSYSLLQGGQLEQAAATAERVLARTGSPKLVASYARQRYYATVLMALAHERASFGDQQFATEGKRYLSSAFGNTQGSPTAHTVAAAYLASVSNIVFEQAVKDGETIETPKGTVQLIPTELASFDLDAARDHMNLALVMLSTRLGFTNRSNEYVGRLDRTTQITNLDKCNGLFEAAQVSDNAKPWIYYAIFRYLATTGGDERDAYRFGISARSAAHHADSGFSQATADTIADWIDNDSTYVFTCACPKPFDRTTDRCLVCGQKNIKFEGNPKPEP